MAPKSRPVRWYHTWHCIGLIALASFVSDPALGQGGPPAPKVVVSKPIAKRIPRWDEFTGRFEPMEQVEVRPRVSGFIDKIHFKDGQMVQKDDVLFTIDPRPYQIAVDSAKADVMKAKAQVVFAFADFERGEQLVEIAHRAGEGTGPAPGEPGYARPRRLSRLMPRCAMRS